MTGPANLLIISDEGPQTGTAGALLLHRLLSGYPPERLRVLADDVPTVGRPLPGVQYRRISPPWRRFERSRYNRLMRSLRAFNLVPHVADREFGRLLEGFRPDIVLCVMQHKAYYEEAHRFARSRGLPLVVVVHDINEEFEPVLPWAAAASRRRDAEFYGFAALRLCISPEMEAFCEKAYGARGTVLYPNRAEDLAPRAPEESRALRGPPALTLGFAGNLNYGYGEGILQMLPAVRAAGARVIIYGREPNGAAAPLRDATDCCEFRGFAERGEQWTSFKRECDAVWQPYPNPAGTMERLYRYHFPSKLPEYLALGMPLIVTGPDYATGLAWARRNLGPDLCASSAAELGAVLAGLASSGEKRVALARLCHEAGERDFNPAHIVKTFRGLLAGLAPAAA
ncbi:MAG TPA: glycosyltransferase [Opitutaceae bacterium]|jgi:hypothetical protein